MATFDELWGQTAPSASTSKFNQFWDKPESAETPKAVYQGAAKRIEAENARRRSMGAETLTPAEQMAVVDAERMLGGYFPSKTPDQIFAETQEATRKARGFLGNVRAGAFEGLTSTYPKAIGVVDAGLGADLQQGAARTTNLGPHPGLVSQAASMVAGLAKFVLEGPVAIAEAGLAGAGEQRILAHEAREAGQDVSGWTELATATSRGILDAAIAKLMLKTGSQASQVARAMFEPSVRAVLATHGIDTAKKLATTWLKDSLASGVLAESQYIIDTAAGHLVNKDVAPDGIEAAKAAAFGLVLPSVFGAIHGGVSAAKRGAEMARVASSVRHVDLTGIPRRPVAQTALDLPARKAAIEKLLIDRGRTPAQARTEAGKFIQALERRVDAPEVTQIFEGGEQQIPVEKPGRIAPEGAPDETTRLALQAQAETEQVRIEGQRQPQVYVSEGGIQEMGPMEGQAAPREAIAPPVEPRVAPEAEVVPVAPPDVPRAAQEPTPPVSAPEAKAWLEQKMAAPGRPTFQEFVASKGIAWEKVSGPNRDKKLSANLSKQYESQYATPKGRRARRGGFLLTEPILKAAGVEDVEAVAKGAVKVLASAANDIKKTFAPMTRGGGSRAAEAALRQAGGQTARRMDIVRKHVQSFHKYLDGVLRVAGKGEMVRFMDRVNRGERQPTQDLQHIADALDVMLKDARDEVRSLGTGALEKFYETYFPKQFKRPEDVTKWFDTYRRNLTGSKTFLRKRADWDLADAVAAGFEPTTYNPVEMFVRKYGEMQHYIAGVRAIQGMEEAGVARRVLANEEVPVGYKAIHEQVGLYRTKNPTTGEVMKGRYYAPSEVADLVNNHLGQGLRGKPWFNAVMGSGNLLNQLQLGLSSFHIGFTGMDAITSKLALAVERTWNYGDVTGAVKNLMGAPHAPISNAWTGVKAVKEWFRPGTQGKELARVIDAFEKAGARTNIDTIYRTHISDKMMEAFRRGNVLGGVFRGLLLPLELPTRAVMRIALYQKWGVAVDLLRSEMANNPGIDEAALIAKARSIWNSADNRMGQLVYDNLFWNRYAKDMAMLTTRSVGWNLGTFREIVGGAFDLAKMPLVALKGKRPELTHRAAYLVALPLTHAAIGGVLNYMFTGQAPTELKDYFFPRTGGVDENGRPNRISLPTYMKDIYHYGVDPLKTLAGKVHPWITTVHEMIQNKDFYGNQIRNSDDPFMQQRLQELRYLGHTATPLSIRNLQQELERGTDPLLAARSFAGLTPAPASIGQTPFEHALIEKAAERRPAGARTPAQAEASKLKREIYRDLAKGSTAVLSKAVSEQKLTAKEASELFKESHLVPLQRRAHTAPLEDIIRYWHLASPQEQKLLRTLMMRKLRSYTKSHTKPESKDMLAKFRAKGLIK